MRYFCVTDVPPPWPLPGFVEPISPAPAGGGVLDLDSEHPGAGGRAGLREYRALFGLRHLVQAPEEDGGSSPGESMVGISYDRQFAVTRPVTVGSADRHVMTPEEVAALPEDCFVPAPGTIVVPAPTVLDVSVLARHGSVHGGRDLLHAVGIAIDHGVADGRGAAAFLGTKVLIDAPGVGVYPTGWYLDVLTKLDAVAREFADTVRDPSSGLPRQIPVSCLSLLHSLLLHRLLETWPAELTAVAPVLEVAPDPTA